MTNVEAVAESLPTALIVAYRTKQLDLSWLPLDHHLVIVHNDGQMDRSSLNHPNITHVESPRNVGFGAAVNAGLERVTGDRVVLVNPDVVLRPEQWHALTEPGDCDIRTVNLCDGQGLPTAVISSYPGPLAALANGFRIGRWFPRGGATRRVASIGLGRFGRAHADALRQSSGVYPIRDRWVSGAVVSIPTEVLRSGGGFDDRYFLYVEDLDLCSRLAHIEPSLQVRVLEGPSALHTVGASASVGSRTVERHRLASGASMSLGRLGWAGVRVDSRSWRGPEFLGHPREAPSDRHARPKRTER